MRRGGAATLAAAGGRRFDCRAGLHGFLHRGHEAMAWQLLVLHQ